MATPQGICNTLIFTQSTTPQKARVDNSRWSSGHFYFSHMQLRQKLGDFVVAAGTNDATFNSSTAEAKMSKIKCLLHFISVIQ